MAGEGKSTISIATISAISAIVIAVITTYGTIAVSAPEAKKVKKELEEISDLKLIANLPIGTIVSSMLKPSLFAESVGDLDRDTPAWVLADGRAIDATSRYSQKSGETVLPDLRGMFLRGMNEGRDDGKQDPQDDRKAGGYQADTFARHDHGLFFHYRSFQGEDPGARPAIDRSTSAKSPSQGGEETRPKNVAVYFYIKIN